MITTIIPCKGRRAHLEQVLPALLEQVGPDDQVIVVDYDCPEDSGDYAIDQGAEVVKLDNAPIFNLSHARNLGAKAAGGDVLVFLDADMIPKPGWFENATGRIVAGTHKLLHTGVGSCAVARETFEAVNGYDESFEGWGDEALDFFVRCERILQVEQVASYKRALLKHIKHSDEERTQFYTEKNHRINQNRSSRHRRAKKGRPVNPGGYGRQNFRADPEGKFRD